MQKQVKWQTLNLDKHILKSSFYRQTIPQIFVDELTSNKEDFIDEDEYLSSPILRTEKTNFVTKNLSQKVQNRRLMVTT